MKQETVKLKLALKIAPIVTLLCVVLSELGEESLLPPDSSLVHLSVGGVLIHD